MIYGIRKDGKSEIQALRYPRDKWDADDARKHCESRGGSFEASKDEGKAAGEDLQYRSFSIRSGEADGAPSTFDRASRSVEVVAATEDPVMVMDPERWEIVPEVLLMSGAALPANRRLPLLDSHSRWSQAAVLGSVRDLRVQGSSLVGRAFFSRAGAGEEALTKVEEGHLTDLSVGYQVTRGIWIPEREKFVHEDRTFQGPLRLALEWVPREISITPVAADARAKVRSAAASAFQDKEGGEMDKKLRMFLESRGLPANATEEEAWAYLEQLDLKRSESAPPAAVQAGAQDPEQIRLEAARAEQARILEIRAMCEKAGYADLADGFIRENRSADEARREIFEKLTASRENGMGFRPAVDLLRDERDKFRSAASDALCLRAGLKVASPVAGAQELRGLSLRELARECLRIAGVPHHGDVLEMVGRALTTSDFPYILANVANKSLFEGYETAAETWRTWCATGQVSDFKTHTLVRASEFDDLEEVPEHGLYKYGGRTEAKEEYAVATYGKLFAITRQTIVNDDLNALSDVPRGHGEAAARKLGDIAYAVLTTNPTMGDGVALFHSSHGNIGTGGAVSVTTIAEAIKLMKLQKDIAGKRRLNIRPVYFIAPVTLEGSTEQFFRTQLIGGASNQPNLVNPYQDPYFTRVYEPRLDDASATAWYLAGPKGKTVTVFFLNGQETPYMETQQGWSVDGVEYKVRIDAGAKAVDWKALVKNAGA